MDWCLTGLSLDSLKMCEEYGCVRVRVRVCVCVCVCVSYPSAAVALIRSAKRAPSFPRLWDMGGPVPGQQPLAPNPKVPADGRDGEALHPIPQPRVQQLFRLR